MFEPVAFLGESTGEVVSGGGCGCSCGCAGGAGGGGGAGSAQD